MPRAYPLPTQFIILGGSLIPALVPGSCLDACIFLLIPALVPGSCLLISLEAFHYLFKGVYCFLKAFHYFLRSDSLLFRGVFSKVEPATFLEAFYFL